MSRKKVFWIDKQFDPKTNKLVKVTHYCGVANAPHKSKKEGIEYEYYKSGAIKYITSYKKGWQEGVEEHYNDKGILIGSYSWHKGELSGKSFEYYDNGSIKWERVWRKGLENGEHIKYRLDSSMAQKIVYKNGKICSVTYFDNFGKVIETIDYTSTIYIPSGKRKIIV